jgi:hypothetical protein
VATLEDADFEAAARDAAAGTRGVVDEVLAGVPRLTGLAFAVVTRLLAARVAFLTALPVALAALATTVLLDAFRTLAI